MQGIDQALPQSAAPIRVGDNVVVAIGKPIEAAAPAVIAEGAPLNTAFAVRPRARGALCEV